MPEIIQPLSSPSNNSCMDAALEYLDMGFSVIPVNRFGKKPYLSEWKPYQTQLPTTDEIEAWWTQWPDANVAIITGNLSGLFVVDADGPIGIQYMTDNLPKTTVYSNTGKGVHAFFRMPEHSILRNRVKISTEVDVRGEGGYVVAAPSIHENGNHYTWVFLLGGWDDLPVYQPPTASINKTSGNLNLDLSRIKTSPVNQPVAKGSRNHTLAQLAGKWINSGLDDAEIEILAKSWNNGNNPPLGAKELSTTLDSVKKTHTRNHPAVDVTSLEIDFQPFKEKSVFPEKLLSPGGMMQDVMEWITSSSAVSIPEFNLAGAIAMIGTLAGHRFQTETKLKTNFYVIAIGHAGSGKDAPQEAIPAVLLQSTEMNCIGPQSLPSDAALLKYVANQTKARTLIFLDEIGLMLKSIKRPNSAGYEIQSTLMKLFSSVNRKHVKPYASGDDLVVHWHHISFYGASTPSHFWQSFTRSDATDGFLARILIFESHQNRVISRRDINFDVPKNLIKSINEFSKFGPPPESEIDKNLIRIPVAITIPKSHKAEKYFLDWEQSIIDKQNIIQEKDEGIAAIYGRAPEHAHKLGLNHAISLQGTKLKFVEIESVEWAIDMMDHQTEHIITQIRDNISENDWHQHQQRILKAIRRYSTSEKPGASIRDIYRSGVKVPEKILIDLLHSLQSSGEILKQSHKPNRGRAVDIYAIAKECVNDTNDTLMTD